MLPLQQNKIASLYLTQHVIQMVCQHLLGKGKENGDVAISLIQDHTFVSFLRQVLVLLEEVSHQSILYALLSYS